jgi:carbonic anhydrase/acetyltransferase-like protein (isoleucine patch superfamily)
MTDLSRESLKALYLELDRQMRERWKRSLPLEEYVFDRFERAKLLDAGEGSSIHHLCYVYGRVVVGKKTWIGPMTLVDGSGGGVEIGDNCSISAGVQIYTHDTVQKRLSGGVANAPDKAPVKIGNSCYIGPQCCISSGVELGDFCLVGANSFVSRSFPAGSVIMGTPATLRGHVEQAGANEPTIRWLPKDDLSKTVEDLQRRLQDLEARLGVIEEARH